MPSPPAIAARLQVAPATGLQDLAENHVVNVGRRNSRALECTGDRESSEVSGRQRRQNTLQSAHRSSCSAKNNRSIAQTHLDHSTFPIFGPACRCHRLPARATIVAMHPLVTRIDHVGIAVADFDEAVAFYARAFHMTVDHEEVNTEQVEAMLRVGDRIRGSRFARSVPTPSDDSSTAVVQEFNKWRTP